MFQGTVWERLQIPGKDQQGATFKGWKSWSTASGIGTQSLKIVSFKESIALLCGSVDNAKLTHFFGIWKGHAGKLGESTVHIA